MEDLDSSYFPPLRVVFILVFVQLGGWLCH